MKLSTSFIAFILLAFSAHASAQVCANIESTSLVLKASADGNYAVANHTHDLKLEKPNCLKDVLNYMDHNMGVKVEKLSMKTTGRQCGTLEQTYTNSRFTVIYSRMVNRQAVTHTHTFDCAIEPYSPPISERPIGLGIGDFHTSFDKN